MAKRGFCVAVFIFSFAANAVLLDIR